MIWENFGLNILVIISSSILLYIFYWVLKCIKYWKIQKSKNNVEEEIIDTIGRKEEVKILKKSIDNLNKKDKMNRFSIEGPYGTGKSTVMKLLSKELLSNINNIVININSWEGNKFYSPIDKLLIKIIENAYSFKFKKKNIKNKFFLNWKTKFWIKNIVNHNQKKEKISYKKYTSKYDFLKQTFYNLEKGVNDKKIYILIDELDRSDPNDVISFLETLNHLFLESKNIIIIYAFERDKIINLIYKKLGINDENYIFKFIDYSFALSNNTWTYFLKKLYYKRFMVCNEYSYSEIINIFSLRDINNFISLYNSFYNHTKNYFLAALLISYCIKKKCGKYKNRQQLCESVADDFKMSLDGWTDGVVGIFLIDNLWINIYEETWIKNKNFNCKLFYDDFYYFRLKNYKKNQHLPFHAPKPNSQNQNFEIENLINSIISNNFNPQKIQIEIIIKSKDKKHYERLSEEEILKKMIKASKNFLNGSVIFKKHDEKIHNNEKLVKRVKF